VAKEYNFKKLQAIYRLDRLTFGPMFRRNLQKARQYGAEDPEPVGAKDGRLQGGEQVPGGGQRRDCSAG
jgi:hypothetical protein